MRAGAIGPARKEAKAPAHKAMQRPPLQKLQGGSVMTHLIRLDNRHWPDGRNFPEDRLPLLVGTATRAPSVFNTQPWRFRLEANALELHADPGRGLPTLDPVGREMLISCGAALFGLRLAVRGLGYVPVVSVLPDPAHPDLLARVYLGEPRPITTDEQQLLAAVPHRHTHRGPFSPDPLPAGLLAALRQDAAAEGASLTLVDEPGAYRRLDAMTSAARARQRYPAMADVRRWTRPPGSTARDGIPASACPVLTSGPDGVPGRRLVARDFDLGRGWATSVEAGPPPAATAVVTTVSDTREDWLNAGQAMHRLLLRAASRWVFASLTSEPIEFGPVRALIRSGLALPGPPQMLLQFGRSHTVEPTARRPAADVLADAASVAPAQVRLGLG